jgi:PQQ-dependent dehydrogenase (s-GDH family)
MKRLSTLGVMCSVLLAVVGLTPKNALYTGGAQQESLAFRVVATGLENPWEITWGPDGVLWVTEKSAGRLTRVQPSDGSKKTALKIPEVLATKGYEDGLLGMALHPKLLGGSRHNYVYVAYTYDANPSPEVVDRRAKIRRYTYDRRTQILNRPVDLITGLPASDEHNSGRLIFGSDRKLYYTIGDQGHNQAANYCKPIRAQELPIAAQVRARNWTKYQGKVLRLNLDGSIPADNPVIAGVRSHIYSYGHRNAQGIVFGPGRKLYAVEHGPKSDDEVNIIRGGKNYGWPHVAGFRDDKAYVYANWSASRGVPCSSLTYSNFAIPPSVPRQKETEWSHPEFAPPIKTLYTVRTGFNFRDPACAENQWYFVCWPTVAPSSVDIYTARKGVRGWASSLLMTSLKHGTVYRLKLSANGKAIRGDAIAYWTTVNRYRDIAIKPDNRTFYVATDKNGVARDRSGRPTLMLENPGAILEFRYTGQSG